MYLGKLNHLQQSEAEETTNRVLKAISSENLKTSHIFCTLEMSEENSFQMFY